MFEQRDHAQAVVVHRVGGAEQAIGQGGRVAVARGAADGRRLGLAQVRLGRHRIGHERGGGGGVGQRFAGGRMRLAEGQDVDGPGQHVGLAGIDVQAAGRAVLGRVFVAVEQDEALRHGEVAGLGLELFRGGAGGKREQGEAEQGGAEGAHSGIRSEGSGDDRRPPMRPQAPGGRTAGSG